MGTKSGKFRCDSELNIECCSNLNSKRSLKIRSTNSEREILRTTTMTQKIRHAFPKPAFYCNEKLQRRYDENIPKCNRKEESISKYNTAVHEYQDSEIEK